MQPIRNNHTARGAIDMAVHDALAQSSGHTLAAPLGATPERVRVSYIPVSYTHLDVYKRQGHDRHRQRRGNGSDD